AALPTTANGKVDRRRLASMNPRGIETDADAVAVGETERALVYLWRDVLGLTSVGVERNFFDLGGHSLLLFRLQKRIEERFGRRLHILQFFKHPTVRSRAGYLDAGVETSGDRRGARARAERTRAALDAR